MSTGPNVNGLNVTLAQMSMGPNVSGPNVHSGPNVLGPNVFGPIVVLSQMRSSCSFNFSFVSNVVGKLHLSHE